MLSARENRVSQSKRKTQSAQQEIQEKLEDLLTHYDSVAALLPGSMAPQTPHYVLEAAALFTLEQVAWGFCSLLESVCFELRVGPANASQPSKCLDLLVRESGLPLGLARRLKQFVEYRSLSQRPRDLLEKSLILDAAALAADREILCETRKVLLEILATGLRGSQQE